MANKKTKKSDDTVKAQPKGQGHDPLAGGEKLYNEKNTSDATAYKADRSELEAEKTPAEARAEKTDSQQAANERSSRIANDQTELDNGDNVDTRDRDTGDVATTDER